MLVSAGKLSKEKKNSEEQNKKLSEDLAAEEDKCNHLNRQKQKLEGQLDEGQCAHTRMCPHTHTRMCPHTRTRTHTRARP